jgi:4-amino-4-deoxy-L-arabinose transferase-like glycosyltransferase
MRQFLDDYIHTSPDALSASAGTSTQQIREPPRPMPHKRSRALAIVILLTGLVLVASTYRVLSHTADEPAHLAAGLEWHQGAYTLELQHPPLSRLVAATGPYLAGYRVRPDASGVVHVWDNIHRIFFQEGDYTRVLLLSRLGVLPFFVLASLVVWTWSRRLFGETAGLLSLLVLATSPTVLAHAGLGTTDMVFAALFVTAIVALLCWLEQPGPLRAALLGLAFAGALAAKLSAVVYFPACALVAVLARRWRPARERTSALRAGHAGQGVLALLIAGIVVWGVYRFDFGKPSDLPNWNPPVNRLVPSQDETPALDLCFGKDGLLHDLAVAVSNTPQPAPGLWGGWVQFCGHARYGHRSYFLGHQSEDGFLLYYPVAWVLKTPIPFLVAFALGAAAMVLGAGRRYLGGSAPNWRHLAPLACGATIMLLVFSSRVQIGVRLILPVFLLFAPVAGWGLATLLDRSRKRWQRALGVGLLLWQIGTPLATWPSYLSYFNLLAGPDPGRVLNDSNLDWGQDVLRLAEEVKERGIERLHVAIFFRNICELVDASVRWIEPDTRVTGWVAISDMYRQDIRQWHPVAPAFCVEGTKRTNLARRWIEEGNYDWLGAHEPVEIIGSIRLYYIEE